LCAKHEICSAKIKNKKKETGKYKQAYHSKNLALYLFTSIYCQQRWEGWNKQTKTSTEKIVEILQWVMKAKVLNIYPVDWEIHVLCKRDIEPYLHPSAVFSIGHTSKIHVLYSTLTHLGKGVHEKTK
jgi:hypothetical protein